MGQKKSHEEPTGKQTNTQAEKKKPKSGKPPTQNDKSRKLAHQHKQHNGSKKTDKSENAEQRGKDNRKRKNKKHGTGYPKKKTPGGQKKKKKKKKSTLR